MRVWAGLGIGMLLAALALGAPMTPLTPPLGKGSLLTELKNPIRRHQVLAHGSAADGALVAGAFLAGNWDAFDSFAALVLDGRTPALGTLPDTPHAHYWAMVMKRPAAELRSLLGFLTGARRLHAGLLDRLSRPALPPCDATCQQLLLAYLAAFPAPRHAADPKRLMGPALVARSHYPDELTVGLVGDLGLTAAIPDLERFIRAERRFFQLYTDYSTQPEEVGQLYWEALRALVKLSAGDPARARAATSFLNGERTRLKQPSKPLGLGQDRYWMETTSESPMQGSTSEVREGSSGGDETPPPPYVTQLSKLPSLALAVRALAKDPAALATLGGRVPLRPEARWVDRIDVSSAIEGRGGKVQLDGQRLLVLDHTRLTAVDPATGNRLYDAHLEGVAGAGDGVQAWVSSFALLPAGLFVPATVRSMRAPAPDLSYLLAFDPGTGEVTRQTTFPAGFPSLQHGSTVLAAAGDGIWYQDDRLAVKLAPDGKELERRTLAKDELLRVAGDKLAHFTTDLITVEGPGKKLVWHGAFADLAGKPAPVVDDVLLRKSDFVGFGRYQTLFAAGYDGKLRWRGELPEQWAHPPMACGDDRVCVWTPKTLFVFGAGGARSQVAVPPGTREAVFSKDVAYLLTQDAVVAQPLGGGAPRTVVGQLTGMSHLVGLSNDCLLVGFYASGDDRRVPSGYYLGCFPSH